VGVVEEEITDIDCGGDADKAVFLNSSLEDRSSRRNSGLGICSYDPPPAYSDSFSPIPANVSPNGLPPIQ
jgi:hypothetical protein